MDASGTRLPTPGAFTGRFQKIMEGAKNWKEVAKRLKGETVTYFDFETTGIPDYDGQNITNDPIQLGAVQVKNGKIVKRFNVYINPESKLSEWSSNNLKRDVVDENGNRVVDEDGKPASTLVTPDWLEGQMSQEQALKDFIEFMGPGALLGGQNVPFDVEILKRMADKYGIDLDIAGTIDSKDLASLLPKYDPEKGIDGPKAPDRKTGEIKATSSLGPVANFLGFEPANWHSADGDAEDSYNLVSRIIERAGEEGSGDLSLLDFPAMEKRYKERMDEFKAVVSPNGPATDAQKSALEKFAASDKPQVAAKAKEALQTANTRGAAAEALADIHSTDEGGPSKRRTGLFNEYSADRLTETTNDDDFSLVDLGWDPEEEITIYRGVPKGIKDINAGDWVTDNPQLARDYAGDGDVISMKVKAKDLRSAGDIKKEDGEKYVEEMVYRPSEPDILGMRDGSAAGDIMSKLNEEESDPDFDDVDLSGKFKTFKYETNEEESDPDFADVDLTDAFPEPAPAPEPKPARDLSNVTDADLTPEGVGNRAALLASEVPFFGELDGALSKVRGFKNFFDTIQTSGSKLLTFFGARSDRGARSATKEAKEAKDKIVKLGSDTVKQADQRVLKDLQASGLIPADVTDIDAHIQELRRQMEVTPTSVFDPNNELAILRASLVRNLSDEDYTKLLQEAIKKYGLIDVEASTINDLTIDPGIDRNRNLVVSPTRFGAFVNIDRPRELVGDTQATVALTGNKKLNREMRNLLSPEGGLIHPLGPNVQPVIDNTFGIHDVMAFMLLKRNHEASLDKFRELEKRARERNEAANARYAADAKIRQITVERHQALSKHLMDFMKEAGVEFDSVKAADATGAILDYKTARAVDSSTADMLERSWKFYPKHVLLKALEAARRTKPLYVQNKTGKDGRAGFSPMLNMFYAQNLDAYVHEQGHWLQKLIPTIGTIEHAFLSDRATRGGDTLGRLIDANSAVRSDTLGKEVALSDTGLTHEYTGKVYGSPFSDLFGPDGQFWETFTTGMEDLFINFGDYSRGQNQKAVIGSGVYKEVVEDPYQDPSTGIWYRDSTKTERIKPKFVVGRAKKDGMDTEFQGLIVGLLLMMNDWNN